jgi:hypothetical protein
VCKIWIMSTNLFVVVILVSLGVDVCCCHCIEQDLLHVSRKALLETLGQLDSNAFDLLKLCFICLNRLLTKYIHERKTE